MGIGNQWLLAQADYKNLLLNVIDLKNVTIIPPVLYMQGQVVYLKCVYLFQVGLYHYELPSQDCLGCVKGIRFKLKMNVAMAK